MHGKISKKKTFVKNGLIFAEMNSFFQNILSEDGFIGLEIRPRGAITDVILMVTRPDRIIGEKGRKIRELTSLVQRRFSFEPDKIRLFVDRVNSRNLSAIAQCEAIKFKLDSGVPVRKACHGAVRSIMNSKAIGCEVIVSGKIRGQRAKSMKFIDGIMIHAGHPVKDHVDFATRSVLLKQGVLGIKVKIHKPIEEMNQQPLPDCVEIHETKEQTVDDEPTIIPHELNKEPHIDRYSGQPRHGFESSAPRGYQYRGASPHV